MRLKPEEIFPQKRGSRAGMTFKHVGPTSLCYYVRDREEGQRVDMGLACHQGEGGGWEALTLAGKYLGVAETLEEAGQLARTYWINRRYKNVPVDRVRYLMQVAQKQESDEICLDLPIIQAIIEWLEDGGQK